jgi:hypothetical protein
MLAVGESNEVTGDNDRLAAGVAFHVAAGRLTVLSRAVCCERLLQVGSHTRAVVDRTEVPRSVVH